LSEGIDAPAPHDAFLKKEHRVGWRDRLAHWWRGFGAVSKSTREGRLLWQLEEAGIGCPQALAFGETDGRAFLLLSEQTGLVELRLWLQEHPLERVALAQALGAELARVHAAGFYHRDLYSKHILVARDDQEWRFSFLDWQRGRRVRRLAWRQRLRDLATLDATLAPVLASRRERLLLWHAYLVAQERIPARPNRLLGTLCRLSARLQRKRRIRELRQLPLAPDRQRLIWLDGEALCVTPRFQEVLARVPAWLEMPAPPDWGSRIECVQAPSAPGRTWNLVRRWSSRPGRWLWSWWRRPLFPAPEFEQAAAIVRLERFGIETPSLLALGHRALRPWQKYSFLLTEAPAGVVPLLDHVRGAEPYDRGQAMRQAGNVLRRVHEAGYRWKQVRWDCLAVRPESGAVVLTSVEGLKRHRTAPERLARKELTRLALAGLPELSADDRLAFFLGYHALDAGAGAAQRFARLLAKRLMRAAERKRRVAS
jgi:tRNA A-37 threonylcarbamoyl transferase component Bud32